MSAPSVPATGRNGDGRASSARGAGRSPRQRVGDAFDRIADDGRGGIWIELVNRDRALEQAAAVEDAGRRGTDLPLAGVTVAVKGNIDVAGLRTTAGCPAYGAVPAQSAAAVRRLEAAGAVIVGVTNLDQFATGLVGTRSPYGACPNPQWPGLISGGSSSGSAVAVAAGHVDLALGTDTAGSGRVPAAANSILGLKPTQGRISMAGVVPACRSLDCISFFAHGPDLLAVAAAVASGRDLADPWSRTEPDHRAGSHDGAPVRVASAPADTLDFGGDPQGAARYAAAVDAFVANLGAGASRVDVDIAPFVAAGRLLYDGAFVAERYEAVGRFVDEHPEAVDPIVASIIGPARDIPAWRFARDRSELARLRAESEPTWSTADVLVVPTIPRLPTRADVQAEPVAINTMLGTYTNFVNLLDLCALSLPIGPPTAAGPPVSLTVIAPAWDDSRLVDLARRYLDTAGAGDRQPGEAR